MLALNSTYPELSDYNFSRSNKDIYLLPHKFDVVDSVAEIQGQPELWDKYTMRTAEYGTPHDVSDLWVRYNAWENYRGNRQEFNGPHESVWYPHMDQLPKTRALIDLVHSKVGGILGGIFITKVRPGGRIAKHYDEGWHATHYNNKYGVQLMGNQQQGFHFDSGVVRANPGEIYRFDNSKIHWVTNDSSSDRITLIITTRG